MTSRKRRQRARGLIPWLGHGLLALGRVLVSHPQPFLMSGLLLLSGWALWSHVERADAFRITQVIPPSQSSLKLPDGVLQANLWRVDIRALADELKQQQPWLKEVRVVRRLPNALRIDAIARVPVAQVRLDRWYPLDREGFILPQGRAEPAAQLVRVAGLDRSAVALKTGTRNTDDRLSLALRVLEKLRRAPPSIARRLTEINVADPQQIRFVMDLPAPPQHVGGAQAGGETEIRCGSETELDAHLARLRAALKAMATQPLDVRYIDVRFSDPVIGQRT